MLGVDVKVEDDGHEEVQQAEKEHGLAHALPPSSLLIPQAAAGPPNGPGHPAAGLSRGGRETHPAGQGLRGKATHPPSVHCSHS